jgi:dTMP kinase
MDSSIAYQGVARGLGLDEVRNLNLWATAGLVPDLTIVLDVDASKGLGRVADPNRLEEESADFHSVVCQAFLDLAQLDPARYLVLSANDTIDSLATAIAAEVDRRLAAQ